MRRRVLAVAAVLLLCCGCALAERLASVDIVLDPARPESSRIDMTLLKRMLKLRPGRAFAMPDVDRDFVALLSIGLFDPASPGTFKSAASDDKGVHVELHLSPNPAVDSYRFPGATAVQYELLADEARRIAPIGEVYDLNAAPRLGRVLAALCEREDVEAHCEAPTIQRGGVLVIPVREHRVGRVAAAWDGPAICPPERIVALMGLERLGLLRPSACAAARDRLLATGLIETVELTISPPDSADLVELRVLLRARAVPRPASTADMDLLDGAALARTVRWIRELRIDTPFDLTPGAAAGAAAAPDTALGRFQTAFARAEEETARLAESLGCKPDGPATLPSVARALACRRGTGTVGSEDYAAAMDEATDALLALRASDDVLASLPQREDLLMAREVLRAFDRGLASAPRPMPSIESIGWGSTECLEALLAWRKREPDSAAASYALGVLALGRALATRRVSDESPEGARCYELGGPVAAARLASRCFAEVPSRAHGNLSVQFPLYASLATLASCAGSPGEEGARSAAQMLGRARPDDADALVYAAVGEGGLLADETQRRQSARRLALGLLEFAEDGPRADTQMARLACLALLWGGAEKEAEALAQERLAPAAQPTVEDLATRALIALHLGKPAEAVAVLESAPLSEDLRSLLGCARLAAGDRDGAAEAYGV
jgi:hypothetical protein